MTKMIQGTAILLSSIFIANAAIAENNTSKADPNSIYQCMDQGLASVKIPNAIPRSDPIHGYGFYGHADQSTAHITTQLNPDAAYIADKHADHVEFEARFLLRDDKNVAHDIRQSIKIRFNKDGILNTALFNPHHRVGYDELPYDSHVPSATEWAKNSAEKIGLYFSICMGFDASDFLERHPGTQPPEFPKEPLVIASID